jgi:glycosyltransferase involved in cell wall biosynthesis
MLKQLNNKKVIIFAHHPAPYRDYFFRELMKIDSSFLVVYFYDHPSTHKEWSKQIDFDYETLIFDKRKTIKIPFIGDLHLELFNFIFKKDITFVVPGYVPFTSLLLMLLFNLLSTPFVYSADTVITDQNMNKNIKKKIIYRLIKSSKAIWVPGLASEEYHKFITVGSVPIFRGVYLLNPTDILVEFKNHSKEVIRLSESNSFKFLFIGKLISSRNIRTLCEAFNLLTSEFKAILVVVGDGPDSKVLSKFADANSNIMWIPSLTFEEIHSLYRIADVYIHPGEEPYSLSLQEAFYHNIPLIASNKVGASVDLIVDSVNGYLLESLNVRDIYLKMKQIMNNPLDPVLLKKENFKISQNLSIDKILSNFINNVF